MAEKVVIIGAVDFLTDFTAGKRRVLDIRGEGEARPLIDRFGPPWISISRQELRRRQEEISRGGPLFIVRDTGAWSDEARAFPATRGITDTLHAQGGHAMIGAADPGFVEALET